MNLYLKCQQKTRQNSTFPLKNFLQSSREQKYNKKLSCLAKTQQSSQASAARLETLEVLKTRQEEREDSPPHRHELELHPPQSGSTQHLQEVPRLSDDGWLHALLLCTLLQYSSFPTHVRASWAVLLGEEDVQGETAASHWPTAGKRPPIRRRLGCVTACVSLSVLCQLAHIFLCLRCCMHA